MVGAAVGEKDGAGVGEVAAYVGASEGETVGDAMGANEGRGVGLESA